MVQLTEAVIKSKTRISDLNEVKNLNLWGQGLTGLSVLALTPNVEILSLSVNSISSLRDFLHCPALVELYLRKNDVRYLMALPSLRVLWLSDNPCSSLPNYRSFVIGNLPQLEKLDNMDVTQAERDASKHMQRLQPATLSELLLPPPRNDAEQQGPGQSALAPLPPVSSSRVDNARAPSALAAASVSHSAAAAVAAVAHHHEIAMPGGVARAAGQATLVPHNSTGAHIVSMSVSTVEAAAVDLHQLGQQQQLQPGGHPYNPQRYSSQAGAAAAQSDDLSLPVCLQPAVEATARPGWSPGAAAASSQPQEGPQRSSRNVLYAVMALLADLDACSLAIVQKEVQQRLQGMHDA